MTAGVKNSENKAIYQVKVPVKLQKAGSLRLSIYNTARIWFT